MSQSRALTARLAGSASLLAILCFGCNSSSEVAGLLDASQAESTASAAHTNAALSALALEAALFEIDAVNFAPLTAPPTVSATGTPIFGTVTIDFGAGTDVNNATVAGTVIAAYTVTGNSVSINVTPSGLTTNTQSGGTMTLTGSMTVTATLNGTPTNIAGAITGTMTATSVSDTVTITPNLTYVLDGTPTTGDITLDGTIGIDSSRYGDWTATLTAINATVSQATRAINSGTLVMDRNFILPITATLVFTGSNIGTIDVNPSGYTRSFSL